MTNTTTGVTIKNIAVFSDVNGDVMDGGISIAALQAGESSGTVTNVAVPTGNGFSAVVTNPTTTPSIALHTTVTGIIKGNGSAMSAAVADTDYQLPISLTTTGTGAATFIGDTLNIPTPTTSSGTVTSVSVATASGVSGSVTNPTTTPAITVTLGAISPTSVAASGTVTGSNLSGTNTGDNTAPAQTITGFSSTTGTVTGSDSILTALEKINGNTALLTGAIVFNGLWNATTNTPTLVSGVGTKGTLYKVSVAGTTTIDGISQWNVGDCIVFDGTTWDKIDGLANEVISVAGRTGNVVLAQTDVSGTVANTTTVNGHALSSNVVVSASDITTGTLPAAQLPNPSASTLGGVESIAAVTSNFLTSISTSGVPAQAQPAFTDISGTAAAAQLPLATTGAFGAVKPDGSSITVSSGVISAAPGAFGSLTTTGNSGASTLSAGVLNVPTYSATGLGAVPTTTTVNGHALSSNVVVSASDVTTGTLPAAQLPLATTSAFGAVKPDGTTITITAGVISAAGSSGPTFVAGSGTATAGGSNAFAAGGGTNSASGTDSIAIGFNAHAAATGSIGIGAGSSGTNAEDTALGFTTVASGGSSTALGYAAGATGANTVALGVSSTASASSSVVIGNSATDSNHANSVVIGPGMGSFATNDIRIGNATQALIINSNTTQVPNLTVGSLNGGTGASASTFWRGDGTWSAPSGAAYVAGSGTATASGTNSFAAGSGASATATNAVAIGQAVTSGFADAIVIGQNVSASNIGDLLIANSLGDLLYVNGSTGDTKISTGSFLVMSSNALPSGATGNVPTLTSGPVTGDPTKWIPISDNGTTRYIPSW